MTANRVGSMFTWFFTAGPVTDWKSASKSDTKAFGRFFRAMLDHGVYLPPSQYEAAFLSTAHTEEDVQRTIAAAKQAFRQQDMRESVYSSGESRLRGRVSVASASSIISVDGHELVSLRLDNGESAVPSRSPCASGRRPSHMAAIVQQDDVSAANPPRDFASMYSAEGAFQSYPVTFHMTGCSPNCRAMRNTAGRRPPKGGRNRLECSPTASLRARRQASIRL